MELIITLPLWLILIQLLGAFVNSNDFVSNMSLKKYLVATSKVEAVDALSFNSFLTLIYVLIFGQALSSYFILSNSLMYILPFFALMLIATIFLGIFRFRLSIIRDEVLSLVQIVVCQCIIFSALLLSFNILQTNSFLLRLLFLTPIISFVYASELQLVRSSSVYMNKRYVQIQSSYIRLLFQSALIVFFVNLTFTNSDWSILFKDKFSSEALYLFALSLFVLLFQVVFIVISNIYIKFQPLRDYSSILRSVKTKVIFSLLIFILICLLKVLNVF